MTDRELALELLRFCEDRLLDSIALASALKTLLGMKPTLSSGTPLNESYMQYVEQSARDAAWTIIHEPFEKLIQSVDAGSDGTEILQKLRQIAAK
jgi:hypothetical protein